MTTPTPIPAPPPAAQTANEGAMSLRDRLLIKLIEDDPSLLLLQRDGVLARLVRQDEPCEIFLLSAPAGVPPEALSAALRELVKTVQRGSPPTHFVVIGGDDASSAAIAQAVPVGQAVPMGFHQLRDGVGLVHVKGPQFPLLERAAAGVDAPTPYMAARLAAAQEKGRALVAREQAATATLGGRGPVTTVLIVVCVALLALSYAWGTAAHDAVLQRMGANIGAAVRAGEVYRLFASAFLHANLMHLAFNMFALWSLGPFLESLLGRRRYLVLYAASALGGAVASTLFGGGRSSVGASGAIWGLMIAVASLSFRPKGLLPPLLVAGMRRRAITPLLLNLAISLTPGIDLLAHVGGGIVGGLLVATVLTDGLVPVDERGAGGQAERAPSTFYAAAAWLLGAAMALSIVVALLAGRPWQVNAPPHLQRTSLGDTGVSPALRTGTFAPPTGVLLSASPTGTGAKRAPARARCVLRT